MQNPRATDAQPAPAQSSVSASTASQHSLQDNVPVSQVAGLWRWLFVALGGVFVALGLVGVVLPGIPTTPFLLLASYFFVRSSPALHQRLLRSKLFGPTLRDWQRHRGVKRRTKWISITCCSLMICFSIATGGLPWTGRAVIAAAGAYGMWFVARLPTVPNEQGAEAVARKGSARKVP